MTRRAFAFGFALLVAASPVFGSGTAFARSGGTVASLSSSAQTTDEASEDESVEDTFEYAVSAIPPIEGVVFTIDGVTKATNREGTATFAIPKIDGKVDKLVGQRVIVGTEEIELDERSVARFSRSLDRREGFSAVFSVFYKVGFEFIDASGTPMPASSVDSISVKSSTGEVLEFDAFDDIWLLGTRVAGSARPEVKSIFWTIQDALASGTSVVNRGQTKFNPDTDEEIVVPLLFFDTRFEIFDAFFGFRVGDALLIEAPDGTLTEVPLDGGTAELTRVPRGEYKLTVEGPGLKLLRPVAISRNQELHLKFYTWLDVGLVLIALVLFLVVPVGVGIHRRRKRAEAHSEPEERVSAGHIGSVGSMPDTDDGAVDAVTRAQPARRHGVEG